MTRRDSAGERFTMRPGLISEVRLDRLRHVRPAAGLGWVVTEATEAVSLLDHDLQLVRRVSLPFAVPRLDVSATSQFIAIADSHELVVLDSAGDIRWRRPRSHLRAGTADTETSFHIDADGILWIRMATTRELLALDAGTGIEIDRATLVGPDAAWFVHRPTDASTGLGLLHPDPSPSALISLDNSRIVLRPLRGFDLADFSPAGSRYLTMSIDGFLSVRELATETVLVERHLDDLPGLPYRIRYADWYFEYPALFLTDEIILVKISSRDYSEDDSHLLLSARSLRYRSQIDYPTPRWPGSIVSAERSGRWLTHYHEESTLRLWQIADTSPPPAGPQARPTPLDDEPTPGQLTLF
ncbi:hypothetical protein [Actinoplanes sp. TBRC 11911]|uniref:hypothetical protein n=1 Tax=Actinoplanes sp. TBRC 11911 TaxID=2729386 RepID=UPI001B7D6F6C|nr:hypothetical protein [Actinoplanes sp. TBRC 11911]